MCISEIPPAQEIVLGWEILTLRVFLVEQDEIREARERILDQVEACFLCGLLDLGELSQKYADLEASSSRVQRVPQKHRVG